MGFPILWLRGVSIITEVVLFLVLGLAFVSSLILTKFFKDIFRALGFVGVDVFKSSRVEVPLLGGLSIPLSLVLFLYIGYVLGFLKFLYFVALAMTIGLITFVGLLDDFFDLPGVYKPAACILGGLPILFFQVYDYHLAFPFGISFRISIIYMLLVLMGISVSANTVNMLDVANGVVSLSSIIILITLAFSIFIIHGSLDIYPLILGVVVLLGFLYYNKYPSQVFLGNAPALVIGGYIASLAIMYQVEFPAVVSMFPFIHNSFFFLNKVRSFIEHKKLNVRVTRLDEDEYIADALDENAPITLLRYIVAPSRMKESDVVFNIALLFLFSSALSIVSALLMR